MVVADDGRASAVWLQELRDDSERMERDLGPGAKHRARLPGRSLRPAIDLNFHTDAVEPAPFCDATPRACSRRRCGSAGINLGGALQLIETCLKHEIGNL